MDDAITALPALLPFQGNMQGRKKSGRCKLTGSPRGSRDEIPARIMPV
jgi:hypothetical protein